MSSKFLMLPLAALAAISMAGAASAQISPSLDPTSIATIPDTNNSIFVTGTATERFKSDRVTAILAVETVNKKAGAALEANSKAMDSVISALEGASVRENETSTAYFSVYPNYNYTEFGTQKLSGYTVTNSIMVESADLSNVSEWIDAAVDAGAESTACHLQYLMKG